MKAGTLLIFTLDTTLGFGTTLAIRSLVSLAAVPPLLKIQTVNTKTFEKSKSQG
jgi:hypothetical protein